MRPCIYLVDDDPDLQTIMHAWLEPKYEAVALKSGLELLGALHVKAPDLVILDLNMPELDGFEICRLLRGTPGFEKLPVLFLTASKTGEDYRRNMSVGGNGYLVKPVGPHQLFAAIDALLAPDKETADVGGGD